MGEAGPLSIAVVCEAPADQATACDLADRILSAEINWLTPALLNGCRRWCGLVEGQTFLKWAEVRGLARDRGIQAHGHFSGEPGAPDAYGARLALLLFTGADEPPQAVLLIRDTDGDGQRRLGLNQAREARRWSFGVTIGLAHPKRECWVLAGFEPANNTEDRRLRVVRRDLGFNPCERADRLTAKADTAKRSAKRVLQGLTGGDRSRERSCFQDTDLAVLERRGARTGLTDYLGELRERIVPLLRK